MARQSGPDKGTGQTTWGSPSSQAHWDLAGTVDGWSGGAHKPSNRDDGRWLGGHQLKGLHGQRLEERTSRIKLVFSFQSFKCVASVAVVSGVEGGLTMITERITWFLGWEGLLGSTPGNGKAITETLETSPRSVPRDGGDAVEIVTSCQTQLLQTERHWDCNGDATRCNS